MTELQPATRTGRLPRLHLSLLIGPLPLTPRPAGSADASSRRGSAAVLVLVALAALAVRLVPLLVSEGLRSLQGYDDGVHLSAAHEVLAGSLPYADFTFLQPPGVIALMLPFAVAGELLGTDVALAAARVAVMTVAAVNAALIAHLLRGGGVGAQLVGGGLYAVWSAAVVGERTVWLEPLLNVGVLTALVVLAGGRTRGRLVLAGAVLGLTCSIKVWPVLLAAAMLVGLLAVERRSAAPWALGVGLGGLAWGLPVLAVAPREAVTQIVSTQAGRVRSTGLTERLAAFDGSAGLGRVRDTVPMTVRAALVLAVLLALLAAGMWLRLHVWTALSALTLVEVVLLAPSFYDHYATYAAPGVCLLTGAVAGRVPRRYAVPAWVGFGLTGAVLAVGATNHVAVPAVPRTQVQAFVAAHGCVWSNDRAVLLLGDADTPRDRDCPVLVDGFGEALARGMEERDQAALLQLRDSDAALVLDHDVAAWPRRPSTPVQRYLQEHFVREDVDLGPLVAWTRVGAAPGTAADTKEPRAAARVG